MRRRMKRRAEGCELDSEESLTLNDEDHESLDEAEGEEEEEEEIACEANFAQSSFALQLASDAAVKGEGLSSLG